MSFGTRLREAFRGAINAEIARKLKVTDAAVKNYIDGREPDTDKLRLISILTGCSIHWLLTGEGPKWVKSVSMEGESPVFFGEAEREIIARLAVEGNRTFDEEVRELVIAQLTAQGHLASEVTALDFTLFGSHVPRLIPVRLWGEVQAGKPLDVFEMDETVLIAEDLYVEGREMMVLRVRGESMIDEGIYPGDLLVCVRQPTAENGDTVIALIDGDKATVKKFRRERGKIVLSPRNPAHKPMVLDPGRVEIQAVVIGKQSRM